MQEALADRLVEAVLLLDAARCSSGSQAAARRGSGPPPPAPSACGARRRLVAAAAGEPRGGADRVPWIWEIICSTGPPGAAWMMKS